MPIPQRLKNKVSQLTQGDNPQCLAVYVHSLVDPEALLTVVFQRGELSTNPNDWRISWSKEDEQDPPQNLEVSKPMAAIDLPQIKPVQSPSRPHDNEAMKGGAALTDEATSPLPKPPKVIIHGFSSGLNPKKSVEKNSDQAFRPFD